MNETHALPFDDSGSEALRLRGVMIDPQMEASRKDPGPARYDPGHERGLEAGSDALEIEMQRPGMHPAALCTRTAPRYCTSVLGTGMRRLSSESSSGIIWHVNPRNSDRRWDSDHLPQTPRSVMVGEPASGSSRGPEGSGLHFCDFSANTRPRTILHRATASLPSEQSGHDRLLLTIEIDRAQKLHLVCPTLPR
ncbi:hypothetical protein BO70DRAFT_68971 [Aspergillus heteromorphus CBS 117.55]|uniref:Uncharacterized protein n=1 Tax=Aspergillus heteromorphus CBS 117.55 TaxID=1448321 RepID=A0A317VXA6_9EURO|nr:uncharacterized protein BO70DRAFT_68971 [Aspergillus heteromorphus CBS 117.55]PWY77538.1 hypothetical protein BO70DRAFT_68971 [Aspergillus heteromorphus CBS 117.55]